MTPQDFQTIIREARKRAGLTQTQLADMVGVTQYTITQFETDKQNLTLDTVCKMLTVLHVQLSVVDEHQWQVFTQMCDLAHQLES